MKRHFYRLQLALCIVLFLTWSSLKISDTEPDELRILKNKISTIEDAQRYVRFLFNWKQNTKKLEKKILNKKILVVRHRSYVR